MVANTKTLKFAVFQLWMGYEKIEVRWSWKWGIKTLEACEYFFRYWVHK